MSDIIIRIITGFTGTLGFGIVFNLRKKFLILGSLGGLLSTVAYELFIYLGVDEMLSCFVVASAITLYAEILARIVKTPTTTFIITSLIPLIPGGALYYTMSAALEKKWSLFVQNAYYATKIALALAVGIIAVTTIVQLVNSLIAIINNKNNRFCRLFVKSDNNLK